MCLIHSIGGAFKRQPEELDRKLSDKSSDLVKRAFEDIDSEKLIDHHVHIAGLGIGGTKTFVNSKMRTWQHPFHRLKFKVYMSSAGVDDESKADPQVIERLARLVGHIRGHGKHRLLAFDKNYSRNGSVNLEKTEFYVPNEYVFEIARQHPDLFVPNISVNPYRPDAIRELEKWAQRGARIVKWLPNAMGIDPSDPHCDPFYQKMKELDLILLSHGGEEKAVEAEEDQKLGNPLLLRRALDHGVKVIVAHCAGLGTNEDLDSKDRKQRDNFDLFMRLMDEKRYEGLVFGEISAMTQFNRIGKPLQTILEREDLHERLVNGSDYPLPAVNILIRTRPLVKHGYLTSSAGECLREIYDYNPLLFDFVLKRALKHPETSKPLPASVFMTNPSLSV
ncbi:MAG TPA: amidohydrolase family protein [Pyrinomonadaceae bacterium]|jgi:predicted TIM-barrel fold metal-dependent hydrolase|nr:amidohydrolase family protein [Pyrinomonadaceae bacterium]